MYPRAGRAWEHHQRRRAAVIRATAFSGLLSRRRFLSLRCSCPGVPHAMISGRWRAFQGLPPAVSRSLSPGQGEPDPLASSPVPCPPSPIPRPLSPVPCPPSPVPRPLSSTRLHSSEATLHWADYELIDWARVVSGKLRASSYCVRKVRGGTSLTSENWRAEGFGGTTHDSSGHSIGRPACPDAPPPWAPQPSSRA